MIDAALSQQKEEDKSKKREPSRETRQVSACSQEKTVADSITSTSRSWWDHFMQVMDQHSADSDLDVPRVERWIHPATVEETCFINQKQLSVNFISNAVRLADRVKPIARGKNTISQPTGLCDQFGRQLGTATTLIQTQPAPSGTIWEVRGFQDAMKGSDEKPPWVIEDLLMEQSATIVSAQPHAMKSLSWLAACLEAVASQKVWGHFAAPNVKNSLFIETEDPPWMVESRIRGLAKGLGIAEDEPVPGFYYACIGPFKLLKEEKNILELIDKHQLNFIVLSTLQNLLEGQDWKSQQEMQPIMALIIRLSRECPVVLVTHSPWDKRAKRAAGTVTQTANFLTAIHFVKKRDPMTGETFARVTVDSKVGAEETDFSLKLVTEGADLRDPGNVRRLVYAGGGSGGGSKKDAILAAHKESPDATPAEIAEQVG